MFEIIEVPGSAPLTAPLSHAIRAGDFIYVSGQASTDPSTGQLVSGTLAEEFRRTVDNLRRVLQAAGADLEHIVKVGAYLKDESLRAEYNRLYAEAFPQPYPARTTVGNPFQFLLVEIDCVAYVGPR
ncbi:MAG: RidA family protein [Chloroflexi bacterium]|nr:RidA family protein [Chloroflexota bacterium]